MYFQFKDSGGFESLAGGKTTEMQRIDVHERIVALERLNPTPRPTTYVNSITSYGIYSFILWYYFCSPGRHISKAGGISSGTAQAAQG